MGTTLRNISRGYRRLRRFARSLRKRKNRQLVQRSALMAAIVIALGIGLIAGREARTVEYSSLLNTIAKGESNGNYNAYFGSPNNILIRFTDMTFAEVLEWQRQYVEQGSRSSAVGRYQFMRDTLLGLQKELKIKDTAVFDADLQDRLAVRLLERRGLNDYVDGKITREQLAHNLSKEWAALPRVIGENPTASYYADDGLNKVQVSIDEVFAAIATLQPADTNS